MSASSQTYLVREIFGPTVQGEGFHAGAACVFLRFAACNLACTWCDTDFAEERAERLTADEIRDRLVAADSGGSRTVIVTGGEPALQWRAALADELRGAGFAIHMESNGTRSLDGDVDWLTISPKPQFHDGRFHLLPELRPSEIKVVVDDSVSASTLADYEGRYRCDHWFVQPCWGDGYDRSLTRALALVEQRPRWRLSVQLHKLIGVP